MLAARIGKSVVVIDADLEAPGLTYKFGVHGQEFTEGLVGWLIARRSFAERPSQLSKFLIDIPVPNALVTGGRLRLMPAGNGPSLNYFQALLNLRLDEEIRSGEATDGFLDLHEQIAADVRPDYLFIDARTGIASSNLVMTRILADDVVALALDNLEQLEGTREVLRSLTPLTNVRTDCAVGLHLVLSRIAARRIETGPYSASPNELAQASRVLAFLREPADPLHNTVTVDRVHMLHTEPTFVSGDALLLARDRVLDASATHVDYVRLAEALLGDEVLAAASSVIGREGDAEERLRLKRFFVWAEDQTAPDAQLESEIVTATTGLVDESERTADLAQTPRMSLAERVNRLRSLVLEDAGLVSDLADALRELADGYADVGDYEAAAGAVEEEIALWRDRPTRGRGIRAGRRVLVALNSLGIFTSEGGQNEKSLTAFNEAASTWRALSTDSDPLAYEGSVALRNLASALASSGEVARSLETLQEARAIFDVNEELEAPVATQAAVTCSALATLLDQTSLSEEALTAAEDAVKFWSQAAHQRPEEAGPGLAAALNSVNIYSGRTGDFDRAIEAGQASVAIWEDIASRSPDLGRSELAIANFNLAIEEARREQYEPALARGRTAVKAFRETLIADDVRGLRRLAVALDATGGWSVELDRFDEGIDALSEAEVIWRSLAGEDPQAQLELAGTLSDLTVAHARSGDAASAIAIGESAVEEWEAISADKPEVTGGLANALQALAHSKGAAQDRDGAIETMRQALVEYGRRPDDSLTEGQALATVVLSEWLNDRGETGAALEAVDEGIRMWRQLSSADIRASDGLAAALNTRAVILGTADDDDASVEASLEAVAMWRDVARRDGQANEDLAIALRNLAIALGRKNESQLALDAAAEAVALQRTAPPTATLVGSLRLYANLALAAGFDERAAEARAEADLVVNELVEQA